MSQFVIDTPKKLKDKLDMVQSLGDIEIASRLLEEGTADGESELDSNYAKLKCKITAIDKNVNTILIEK
jgi:poly [ADP-ribose] polymerase